MATVSAITKHHYLLILCGGSGPRLWPLSRAKNPKQFLSLLTPHSLLYQTVIRATKIVPRQRIFLITNHQYVSQTKHHLRGLIDPQHIISEPFKKNTAMALLYSAHIILGIDPNAVITALPSDHFINNLNQFKLNLRQAAVLAASHHQIVLIGVSPRSPDPSYGYVQCTPDSHHYHVAKFIEKPSVPSARQLITQPNCFWNSGIYTFTPSALFSEIKSLQPAYYQLLQLFRSPTSSINKIYQQSDNLSIDYAISEKSPNLLLVRSQFYWNDVGEWQSIYSQLPHDSQGQATLNRQTNHISLNSTNCLLSGPKGKIIGVIGLKDMAIIDTVDALLICPLDQSFQVRELVKLITANPKTKRYFLS